MAPTAKEKKYDRQLRLWGAVGQAALERSHVLLINSGSGVAGVEALKNLVLPGIGRFTILDSAVVQEADLGVNFFLDETSLGKSRAEETVRLLRELNPSVEGDALTEPLSTFLARGDNVLAEYSLLLLAAPVRPDLLALIHQHALTHQIPTFYTHCLGYYSAFSLLLPPAYPIVETHPDSTATTDLRLLTPWPELAHFAQEKTTNMQTMNTHDRGHIPYVCVLLHYLEQWKQAHSDLAPSTYKDKSAFRDLVRAGAPVEENFDEACAAVLKSLNPPVLSSAVQDVLLAPEAQNLTATSPSFWLIANAIHAFHQQRDQLPLPGAVPDMKAQSADYLQLQNIYKAKARADSADVLARVREIEKRTGRPEHLAVEEREVDAFCKNAAHIALVRGRPFHVVQPGQSVDFGDRAKALAALLAVADSLIEVYLAFLAWDLWVAGKDPTASSPSTSPRSSRKQHPGVSTTTAHTALPNSSNKDTADSSTQELVNYANGVLTLLLLQAGPSPLTQEELATFQASLTNVCTELARAHGSSSSSGEGSGGGGGELHNIAALTGGLLAQEAVKVLTCQYVPVDNTCVYDGVGGKMAVLRL